jgi:hypothetical protein
VLRLALPLMALLFLAPGAAATLPPPRDPVPALSIDDEATNETNLDTFGTLEVTLSPPTDDTVTVHWATTDGTATAEDYVPDSGTLTFAPRQTTKRIGVIVKGDALDEPDETALFELSDASFATIERARGTLTIVDDDPAPLRLLDASVDARWSLHRRYTRVMRFAIHKPTGAVATVRCHGAGCPVRVGARLRPGVLVDVRIEPPLYSALIGRAFQYRIRAAKPPSFKELCLPPGAVSPKPC